MWVLRSRLRAAVGTIPDGTELPLEYLEVWVRVDGEWKCAADMFNANVE